MHSLANEFERTIRDRRLFRRGQSIVVAVSGGLDSMVLLELMNWAARRYGWHLTVAHLNHKLRRKSSEADARLVRRRARQLGWPAIMGVANVREIARRERLSLEMAARKARHQFLAGTAIRLKIRTVCLAHHADDQLELFFLRLFRGSGSLGLMGMKWRNPSPFDRRIELVRPLLNQSRASLAEFAAERKVRFREDATNESLDIKRNRIRHELLPLIRRHYQPALGAIIGRILDITQAEADFVTEAAMSQAAAGFASKARRSNAFVDVSNRSGRLNKRRTFKNGVQYKEQLGAKGQTFEQLPVAIQRRLLQLQLSELGVAADFNLVEQLRLKPGQPVSVSRDKLAANNSLRGSLHVLVREATGQVRFAKGEDVVAFREGSTALDIGAGKGKIAFGGLQIGWACKTSRGDSLPRRVSNCEWFDADQVGSPIVLRHWRPGDRFQPIGMKTEVKLQDLFVNQKISRKRRRELVLAISGAGEVFWVEGMRISERFKLTKGTNRRLQWCWQRL